MTWKPDEKMTERQIEKELQRQVVHFEEACLRGNVVATIKFEDFARQWFAEYAEIRLKQRTIEGYHQMEKRMVPSSGLQYHFDSNSILFRMLCICEDSKIICISLLSDISSFRYRRNITNTLNVESDSSNRIYP